MMQARHNLVWISDAGRDFAVSHAKSLRPTATPEMAAALIRSGIPAIVRRQERPREDILEVGFSSHEFVDGSRFRVSAEVPVAEIQRTVTPFEVLASFDYRSHFRADLLDSLSDLANDNGYILGVYGSTALQVVTGLPYNHSQSDLDLFLRRDNGGSLSSLWEKICRVGEESGVKLDVELDIGDGWAVKLAELFSGGKTVLAKGYSGAELLRVSQLIL